MFFFFKVASGHEVEDWVGDAYAQWASQSPRGTIDIGNNIVRGKRLQASAIGMLSAIHTVQTASARLVHANASQEDALMRMNQVFSLRVHVCVSV